MDILIKDWANRFGEIKKFNELDLHRAGWYDWFEFGTHRRNTFTKKCQPLVKRLVNCKLFDVDQTYVFLKECMLCSSPAKPFWQLKLCDFDSGNVLYCITLGEEGNGWTLWDFTGKKYPNPEFDCIALSNVHKNEIYRFFGV